MKTDSQIQTDVIQELRWDPSVSHEHIGVAVSDGIVTLSGSIPSYIEKSAAESAALRVSGVKAVVEKIEVKLPNLFQKNDQDIAKAVLEQFNWNTQIPSDTVKVSVENGQVKLAGDVEWEFQRSTAERLVRGLRGVKGIVNKISIKPRIHSAEIKEKIEEALKRAAEDEAKRVSVKVQGSKVSLSGNVHSIADKQVISLTAWSAPGVTSVENNLNVTP